MQTLIVRNLSGSFVVLLLVLSCTELKDVNSIRPPPPAQYEQFYRSKIWNKWNETIETTA